MDEWIDGCMDGWMDRRMDRGMANVHSIFILLVSHHHLFPCRILFRQPCLYRTARGGADPIRLVNMRRIMLELDGRCEKGSFRHEEVGHMAHPFFFFMLLVTCTIESVRVLEN